MKVFFFFGELLWQLHVWSQSRLISDDLIIIITIIIIIVIIDRNLLFSSVVQLFCSMMFVKSTDIYSETLFSFSYWTLEEYVYSTDFTSTFI